MIEQVRSVDRRRGARARLDFRASTDQPQLSGSNCDAYSNVMARSSYAESIAVQRRAEDGEPVWAFAQPERVARETLARIVGQPATALTRFTRTRGGSPGRALFEWRPSAALRYMVVVSRPYWLSFYAKDPRRVAWIPLAVFEISCN